MIIAIDGPAASGKGTLGRKIAEALGYHYLDTGLLYRALARDMMARGDDFADEDAAVSAALQLDTDSLDDAGLRAPGIGEAASMVAKNSHARKALLEFQRNFAAQAPGAVLDGRDIGTIVCPEAQVKIFVTASQEERASRRYKELKLTNPQLSFNDVLRDIVNRDKRDQNRAVAPLVRAEDAHLLETTDLDIETALNAALAIIRDETGQ